MSQPSRKVSIHIGNSGLWVGTLWFEARAGGRESSVFQYAQEWLENPDRFAISPTMLLNSTKIITTKRRLDGPHARALPGPIADAVPDAWGQRILSKDAGRTLT